MPAATPIETLARSLYSACLRDLPGIKGQDPGRTAARTRETARGQSSSELPRIERTRRPVAQDCEIVMFMQTWGTTALGFEGLGGMAMTPAYTVIVSCAPGGASAVYFGGRFAYLVENADQNAEYRMDVANQLMAGCATAARRYVGVRA